VSATTERVRFAGSLGAELAGQLELPDGDPRGWVVFAPCFTCAKDAKAIVHASRALRARGLAVLRYDVTGIGESEGRFADTTFASQVDDLAAACSAARERGAGPLLLAGISLGGAAVLVGAPRIGDVVAVATINAPSDTRHLRDLLSSRAPAILTEGEADVTLFGKTTRIGRALLDDVLRHDPEAAAAKIGRPLMIFHAPADAAVPAEHARRLFTAARHPKSFVAIDDADHLLLDPPGAAERVGEILAAWGLAYF
jgi:alpha-beta hydrolase superfamily lysophospholipase